MFFGKRRRVAGIRNFATYTKLANSITEAGELGQIDLAAGLLGVWYCDGTNLLPASTLDLSVIPSGDPDGVFTPQLTVNSGTASFDGAGLLVSEGTCDLAVFSPMSSVRGFEWRFVYDVISLSSTNGSYVYGGISRVSGGHQCFGVYRSGGVWLHSYCTNGSQGVYAGDNVGTPGTGVETLCQTMRLSDSHANSAITHRSQATLSHAPEQYPSTVNAPNDPKEFIFACEDVAGTPTMKARLTSITFGVLL